MKQAILIRKDLKLPAGKACAQAAHASVEAVLKSKESNIKEWCMEGMAKIVLKVKDEKELISFINRAKESGVIVSLITDAGKTVVEPGTKTAVGIGPDKDDVIGKIVSELKLY